MATARKVTYDRGVVPRTPTKYIKLITEAAVKYNVPSNLLSALLAHESIGFNESVISGKLNSPVGAIGIAQFMPETAKAMGVNPTNVASAIDGAARYLKQNFDQFGDWNLALAAYNAGPGAVSQYKGIPPYNETQNYVKMITDEAGGDLFQDAGISREVADKISKMKKNTPTKSQKKKLTYEDFANYNPFQVEAAENVLNQSIKEVPAEQIQKYTVKKGDTLWDIAQRTLGSGVRWKELQGYTGDPRGLLVGTKLTIPTLNVAARPTPSVPQVSTAPNPWTSPQPTYAAPQRAQSTPNPWTSPAKSYANVSSPSPVAQSVQRAVSAPIPTPAPAPARQVSYAPQITQSTANPWTTPAKSYANAVQTKSTKSSGSTQNTIQKAVTSLFKSLFGW